MKTYYLGGMAIMALFVVALANPAKAENYTIVASCGAQTLPLAQGTSGPYMDETGNICTNATGGGGGGAVTVADGADQAEGAKADAAYTGSGSSTTIGLLKGLYAAAAAPIPQACTGNIPISQTTSTDIKTGSAKIYICSVVLISDTAQKVSLVEGTGSVCGTNTVALEGSTTAANGMSYGANGGHVEVSPTYMFNTSVTANHLCLLQSGSGLLAGHITYIDK